MYLLNSYDSINQHTKKRRGVSGLQATQFDTSSPSLLHIRATLYKLSELCLLPATGPNYFFFFFVQVVFTQGLSQETPVSLDVARNCILKGNQQFGKAFAQGHT